MEMRAEDYLPMAAELKKSLNLNGNQQILWQQTESKTRNLLRERQSRREHMQAALQEGLKGANVELRDLAKAVEAEAVTAANEEKLLREWWLTVMVGGGNFITVQNRMYELIQFHFHRPSEERVNGKGYEMVMHLVHKDGEGKLAVIALLMERGRPQPVIQTVWNNLPLEKLDTMAPSSVIDPIDLIPARRDYFTFMGSLTTPPCSEGVLWLVMKEPIQASPAQMALFARLYPMNARPIQPGSGRIIKESN
eukprot:gene9409-9219_t